jgi:hypothetical protein
MGGQDDQTGTESSECTREYVKECQSECLAETVMTGLPRDYGYSWVSSLLSRAKKIGAGRAEKRQRNPHEYIVPAINPTDRGW